MILTTELLRKALERIVSIERSNAFVLKLSLRNAEDPTYIRENIIVDQLEFKQLFNDNVTDDIQVRLNIQPIDLLELVNYQSSMYATLLIEYVDQDSSEVILDEDPELYTFKVFVHDLTNIAKTYGITAIVDVDDTGNVSEDQASTLIDIDMQLISDVCYNMNKQMFVGELSNVNVEDAIRYLSTVMGVKRINMVTPDNTTKFHHLYIPPEYSSFNVIFDYIQVKYGVYDAGLAYYFTNDILYIYPAYDVKIKRKRKMSVIKINPKTYAGLPNYHDVDPVSNDITLISNTSSIHRTLSNVSAENDGNSEMFILADRVIDGQVKVVGDDISLNNITVTCSNLKDNSIAKESAIPRYRKPTNNIFNKVSKIAESNTELILIGWPNARLYMLDPGMELKYIYDDREVVMDKSGILESASYTIQRSTRHGSEILYTCLASLILRLEIDENESDVTNI